MPRDDHRPPPPPTRAPTHQRADGAFEVRFGPGGALRHLFQQAPSRVLFPTPEPGEPPLAAAVNCAGGLAGGDSLRQEVWLEPGARATVSTAAAEKVYRSLGPDTRVATRLVVGPGAVLEWIPQGTILFDGARLERRLNAELAEGASLLASETLVFGRAARGERLRRGAVLDGWRLRGPDGRLLWVDALALPDDPGDALAAPFGFAGAEALGTLLLAGPGAEAGRDLLRDLSAEARGGATLPRPGLLLARWLGAASAVRASVGGAIVALRAELLGLPPRLPRLWTT